MTKNQKADKRGFFRRRIDKRIEVAKKMVAPDYSVESAGRIKAAFETIVGLGAGLKLLFQRDGAQPIPFSVIEKRWGVDARNRGRVLKRIVFELVLFGLLFLYEFGYAASIIYKQSFGVVDVTGLIVSLMLMGFTLWRVLVALWRFEVIKRRAYVGFGSWLRGK